eukprot:GHVT01074035.1.p1 GENE.GHVT01074035.1~~GHVT01074035.1.p1  ORF type:complete len:471 (+),score=106.88 GHVT01074035.1:746-2158(+)
MSSAPRRHPPGGPPSRFAFLHVDLDRGGLRFSPSVAVDAPTAQAGGAKALSRRGYASHVLSETVPGSLHPDSGQWTPCEDPQETTSLEAAGLLVTYGEFCRSSSSLSGDRVERADELKKLLGSYPCPSSPWPLEPPHHYDNQGNEDVERELFPEGFAPSFWYLVANLMAGQLDECTSLSPPSSLSASATCSATPAPSSTRGKALGGGSCCFIFHTAQAPNSPAVAAAIEEWNSFCAGTHPICPAVYARMQAGGKVNVDPNKQASKEPKRDALTRKKNLNAEQTHTHSDANFKNNKHKTLKAAEASNALLEFKLTWANTAFWRLEQQQEQQQQLDDEDVDNGNAASCDEVPRVVIGSDPREYVGLAEVYSALMVHGGKRQGAWLLTRSRRAEESSEEDPIKNREIVKADGNDGQLRTANIITPCPLIVDADDSSIFQIALDPVGIPTVLDGLVYVHRYTVYNLTGTEKNKL